MSRQTSRTARALFAAALALTLFKSQAAPPFQYTAPPIQLPDGYTAEVVAAPPLVQHPIMACVDDRGRLFVGDSSGVNLKKSELEKELPHRVLMLEDTNGDGIYDKSTVFADKMTFPQGAAWLGGSLYVMSPPGLWKLTDTTGSGVADKREMIVSGFDYTGNAADVHGPFVHPNGRLYWCHGRKGHKVVGKEGVVVHEGLASGIWSCKPDGSDVRWHSLGCGDNPVEVDFTPEGEILGVQNIFYTNPRGDTIVHWLRGGIYPRPDQLKAIEGLPRTLDTMPVVHNYGHVGVSGCTFYRSGALDPDWRGNFFVTHFNTQRLTRMEVTRDGASYKVAEREFLKIGNPDVHLTDVLEDRDGSLLVLDTGGWFRIGCPSSLMAKPDIAGAIYRIKKTAASTKSIASTKCEPWGASVAPVWKMDTPQLIAALGSKDVSIARAAGNALAMKPTPDAVPALVKALTSDDAGVQLAAAHALGALPKLAADTTAALLWRISGEVDRSVEHQAMFALITAGEPKTIATAFGKDVKPALKQRVLTLLDQRHELTVENVMKLLDVADSADPADAALVRKAAEILLRHDDWPITVNFTNWLRTKTISLDRLALIELLATQRLASMPEVIPLLLEGDLPLQQRIVWRILATADKPPVSPAPALIKALASAAPADLPLVLAASAKVSTPELRDALHEFSNNAKQPLSLRLKALAASLDHAKPLPDESFALLTRALADPSPSARLEAARVLVSAKLVKEQLPTLAPLIPALGPLEFAEILKGYRVWLKTDAAMPLVQALKNAPSLATVQESVIRTIFADAPGAFAELLPALQALANDDAARRRTLDSLPARIAKEGRAAEGEKLFKSGIGACVTCHRVGEVGNLVGPNLSTIGSIRVERDILESILFPSNSLARDYEAHAIETADGQSYLGVIRASLPDVLVFADAGAQEHRIPHSQIVSNTTLTTSLMPQGLDKALTEQQLMDLVAFLRSRK